MEALYKSTTFTFTFMINDHVVIAAALNTLFKFHHLQFVVRPVFFKPCSSCAYKDDLCV